MAFNKERLCDSCMIEIHGTECQKGCGTHVHPDVDEDLICPECWEIIKEDEAADAELEQEDIDSSQEIPLAVQ